MEKIIIDSEYINLMQLLKWANVVGSGGDVKFLVDEGLIKVNNEPEHRYRRKLYHLDEVEIEDQIKLVVIVNEHNKD